MRKMEAFPLRRVLPYFELLCFLAAWAVGIAVALSIRERPAAAPSERDVVATDAPPLPDDLPRYQSFRPIPLQEIQEGG